MQYFLSVLVGYLLGSSNMTWFISRWKKVDLRSRGSGNLGTSNAVITLGWKSGLAVAVHDIGKSFLAVVLAKLLFPVQEYAGAVAGVAAVLGHIFPFYLKFRGGKGFAPFMGLALALDWKYALALMVLVAVVTVVTDYLVIGTFTSIAVTPVHFGFRGHSWMLAAILLVASLVILYKHRENIGKILRGQEIGLRSTVRGEHRVKS